MAPPVIPSRQVLRAVARPCGSGVSCHLGARAIKSCFRLDCRPMSTRWIAVVILNKWMHRDDHCRIDRSTHVTVEIDESHRHITMAFPSLPSR